MRYKMITFFALIFLASVTVFFASIPVEADDAPTAHVSELEDELTAIEKELTGLEKEIDELLNDLVDPKITSLSVFFTSRSIQGQVPVSLQIHFDKELLTSRDFDETDRLVLIRGGAMEVYSGIVEPVTHTLIVECFLSSGEIQKGITSTGKAAFKFETARSQANYIEITLTEDLHNKTPTFKLSARHWSKEP